MTLTETRPPETRLGAPERFGARGHVPIAHEPVPRYQRMNEVFEAACDRTPDAIALVCERRELSYARLDAEANRLAHELIARGVGVDSRVGILLHRSIDTYATLLAVQKAGAAFVPIDPGAPADRVAYILTDSGAASVVTTTDFDGVLASTAVSPIRLDLARADIADRPSTRPQIAPYRHDPTAYIIYTSGSTGRPKGVEIAQSSICNFLTVIPDVYDVRPGDRVYQGMTISFDFSIEEIWPTFAHGATIVAAPARSTNLGDDLAEFLEQERVTMMYCVPTLLATIPRDLPLLRSILVGGEACPRELVERWASADRRILNTYGPTEATVTATWCELVPGRPVTIGVPVPTYSIVILDDDRRTVDNGEVGEICIGGVGVARGYVGRPDLTADRFIDHPAVPAGAKLYRTGDLGRWTVDGEVEYLGRADAEVKVRGHRVDLGEIESVLMADDAVSSAVVAMMPGPTGADDLSAYLILHQDARDTASLLSRLHDELHARLPEYMVPIFVDIADGLPMMPSGKVDRKRLPQPTGRRFTAAATGLVVEPSTPIEYRLRDVWAEVLGLAPEQISTAADIFVDLGGHSLLVARLVSRLRTLDGAAAVGIRDVYQNPTIGALAARIDRDQTTPGATAPAVAAATAPVSGGRVVSAGTAQAAFLLLVMLAVTAPVSIVYHLNHGQATVETLRGLLIATVPTYLGVRWVLPALLIRPLARGIEPGEYPLWGVTYLRLWVTDRLLSWAPLRVLSGSPLAAPFLRMLGARIGTSAQIGTGTIGHPALVDIGGHVSIGHNVTLRPWAVRGNTVHVAPIVIGDGAVVGANSILEPGAVIGDGAMVGDQSLVGAGVVVRPGSRSAGSPAHPVHRLGDGVEDLLRLPHGPAGSRTVAAASVAGLVFLEAAAIATIVPSLVLVWFVLLNYGMFAALAVTLLTGPVYVATVCAVVAGGKRLILPMTPDGIHAADSLLGVRKWVVDKLLEMSLEYTNALYATLYTAPWLRSLGARIGRGAEISTVAHVDPDLLEIGSESFLADMASVGGSIHANGYFATRHTVVGRRSFVGNAALLPAGSTTGDASLIGVLTVPRDVEVPADTSWLGSPAMYLPVRQDSGDYDVATTFRPDRRTVAHRWWIEFHRVTLPATVLGVSLYVYLQALSFLARAYGLLPTLVAAPFIGLASACGVVLFCAASKNNLVGTYRPRVEPLWDRFVRRTEFVTALYESAAVPVLVDQLRGTPFFAAAVRPFGVDIGKRTYVDTTYMTEFDLVHIADDAAVGNDVSLQTHLFEDRVMKMSTVTIGAGATVGDRAVVLYDSIVDDGAELAPLSLLMKGEHLPPRSRWSGIPAQRVTVGAHA